MDNKDPITPGILKQMIETEDRTSLQLFMNDVKSEIKNLRKDLNDVVKTISFLSNDNDSIKVEMKANEDAVAN